MSRVTLQRIERGEPLVTMGAYIGAATAVGLELELVDPTGQAAAKAAREARRRTLRASVSPTTRSSSAWPGSCTA